MKISEPCISILGSTNLLTYKLAYALVNSGFRVEVFSHNEDILFTHDSINSYTLHNKVKLEKALKESDFVINLLLAPTPSNYLNWQTNFNFSKYAINTASLHTIFINTLPLLGNHNFSDMATHYGNLNHSITRNLKHYNNVYLGHIICKDDSLLTDLTTLIVKYQYNIKQKNYFSIIDQDDVIAAILTIVNNNYIGKVFELAVNKQVTLSEIQLNLHNHYKPINYKVKSLMFIKLFNTLFRLKLNCLNKNYIHLLKNSKKIATNCVTLEDLNINPTNLNIMINKYKFN